MSDTDFIPRWASPPGDTIKDALEERSLNKDALVRALAFAPDRVQQLLDGGLPLTIDVADRLTRLIGGTVEFWMTRDGQYHADVARVAADEWAQHVPAREMAAFGWISDDTDDWVARIDACLRFFDVKDVRSWETNQNLLRSRTRFRSSQVIEADDYAVAAWLRQSEVELSEIGCAEWDRDALVSLLPRLLPLTRISEPGNFLPILTKRCAEVGVAVKVTRAPRKCPISGAARRLPNGQRSIALTGRYRADDHLWFTFFHEAAHLVLHDSDVVYLDEIEPSTDAAATPDELEADQYASEILVPPRFESALASARRAPFELRRLAREIGVSTGIAIGHLQHRGVLGYRSRFNRLKIRYMWDGPNLERV